MIPYWTVVQTATSHEQLAKRNLKRGGYETYLPLTSVRDRFRNPCIMPLFPTYLFVRVLERWIPIAKTIGVLRVLRNDDHPARLPDHVVDDLHAREINGVVRLPPLRYGQTVRIVRGSLRGQLGVYQGMCGRDRERVLLEFLGRQTPATIRVGDAVAH